MNFKHIINKYGIDNTLKSIFPDLKGLNYVNVNYDNLHSGDIIKNMTFDVDGSWHFSLESVPILFKAVSLKNENIELNKILFKNQISVNDKIDLSEIVFWNGNGFKVEIVQIKNIKVIIISKNNAVQKSIQSFNSIDKKLKLKNEIEWIEGIDNLYDFKSIDNDTNELEKYLNVPFYSNSEMETIQIYVKTHDFAKTIIEKIIQRNGGYNSFFQEDNSKFNDLTFVGYTFIIGFLPKLGIVKINKLDYKKNNTTIHHLSQKLRSFIEGFDKPIFYNSNKIFNDGRFFTNYENASQIKSNILSIEIVINIFKKIVFNYNPEDEFLKINNESIFKLFNRQPEDIITFDVINKFRLDISKSGLYYQLTFYPPGGIYGDWNKFSPEETIENKPQVQFSEFYQDLKTKKIELY